MNSTMDDTSMRWRPLAATLILALGLGLTGCASGGTSGGGSEAGDGGADTTAATAGGVDRPEQAEAETGSAASLRASDVDAASGPDALTAPAIISTGTLTVASDDVAAARFDLDKVVDALGGSIADERTTATSEGEVRLSRLVLRIPSGEFDAAITGIGELGEVTDSTRKAQDVTGEVVDTRARIRAQEQSLARVEILFARAQDIRDIVSIEAQLSSRQAELDSLKGQLAYLEDQTSLSTLTVYLEPTPEPDRPAGDDDDNAFVGGLKAGWQALSTLGAGLATVSGALLPFALVVLLLGVPAAVVARRWLLRHPWRRPTAEA